MADDLPRHLAAAEHADREEPHQHDRSEHPTPIPPVPRRWSKEQANEDRNRDRHDPRRGMPGRDRFQALDGAEHGDRRRHNAVAVEERGAEEGDDEQGSSVRPGDFSGDEAEQREDAALAVVAQRASRT